MILLDTHVLLWVDRDDPALGQSARDKIQSAWRTDAIAVSAISFWEVARLVQLGRVVLPVETGLWRAELLHAGVREIPLDGRVAILATTLDGLHRDPADRFILATAIRHGAALLTADDRLLAWTGDCARIDGRR